MLQSVGSQIGRKVMTNLDNIFKSRDITLPTKVHLVKAMVFPLGDRRCRTEAVPCRGQGRVRVGQPGARHVSHTPAACSFPGENARSWEALGEARPGLRPRGLQPTRLPCPRDSPGKNTEVDCHSLLQGIFLNQELNPGLPYCRQMLY